MMIRGARSAQSLVERHARQSLATKYGNTRRFTIGSHMAVIKKAIRLGAPQSITAVDSGVDDSRNDVGSRSNVRIRQVGAMRRIFCLDPYMSAAELEGLAYRIDALSRNEHINSILMATDETDDAETGCLSSIIWERDSNPQLVDLGGPPPGHSYHVSGGYDPRSFLVDAENEQKKPAVNTELVDYTLSSLTNLSRAIQGDSRNTKIPLISMPHGALTNGGFLWLQGAYAICTPETTFKIDNPAKGLSLDPIGLSYALPRIGHEFAQPSQRHAPAIGMMLGLVNYQASAWDLVACGLATNYVDSPSGLSIFEHELAQLPAWYQQGILKKPPTSYSAEMGRKRDSNDINAPYRNVSVADAVQCFASIRANNASPWFLHEHDTSIFEPDGDVSLDPDCRYMEEDSVPTVHSDLVDIAAAFRDVFQPTHSLEEIEGRLQDIAGRPDDLDNPDEQEGVDIAREFLRRLQTQSPLALKATHQLLQMGYAGLDNATVSSRAVRDQCMERERIVQTNLIVKQPDFSNWAKYHDVEGGASDTATFTAWQHRSIADVTDDQVEELFQP